MPRCPLGLPDFRFANRRTRLNTLQAIQQLAKKRGYTVCKAFDPKVANADWIAPELRQSQAGIFWVICDGQILNNSGSLEDIEKFLTSDSAEEVKRLSSRRVMLEKEIREVLKSGLSEGCSIDEAFDAALIEDFRLIDDVRLRNEEWELVMSLIDEHYEVLEAIHSETGGDDDE